MLWQICFTAAIQRIKLTINDVVEALKNGSLQEMAIPPLLTHRVCSRQCKMEVASNDSKEVSG